jgi:hypothetical protein
MNRASSSRTTLGGRVEDAERISRNEDRFAVCLCPSAADNTARWIAGTAVTGMPSESATSQLAESMSGRVNSAATPNSAK